MAGRSTVNDRPNFLIFNMTGQVCSTSVQVTSHILFLGTTLIFDVLWIRSILCQFVKIFLVLNISCFGLPKNDLAKKASSKIKRS